jgi:hypothetical protein
MILLTDSIPTAKLTIAEENPAAASSSGNTRVMNSYQLANASSSGPWSAMNVLIVWDG